MADIQGRYAFNTNPQIYFNVSYSCYRDGQTVYYRFAIGMEALHSPSSFGYPIYCTIALNNAQVLDETELKPNGTGTWDATTKYYPSDTTWYSVTNTGGGTIPAVIQIYPKYTTGGVTISGTVSAPDIPPAPSPSPSPSPPTLTLSTNMARYDATIRIGATSDADYIGWQYCKDGGNWAFLAYGTDRAISFCPADYGGTHGSVYQFRALAQNADGQQSDYGDFVTFFCASAPTLPDNFTGSPSPRHLNDAVQLTWSPSNPMSGTLTRYTLQAKYRPPNTEQWTDYVDIASISGTATSYVTQPANYDWCNVERGGWLQYVIWAYNSYDIPSAWAVVEIQTKSGLINVYLADGWHVDCPVYINPIDKPQNTLVPADVIYVADNDGHWRPNV